MSKRSGTAYTEVEMRSRGYAALKLRMRADQLAAWRAMAAERGVTITGLIREALDALASRPIDR